MVPRRNRCMARTIIALCLAVPLALVSVAHASLPDVLGGDDKFIFSNTSIAPSLTLSMDIAQNGDIYLAVEVDDPTDGPRIRVYRSTNGGDSWSLWGTIAVIDGLVATGASQPCLHVAEGNQNRCYVAYRYIAFLSGTDIAVAYSPLNLASASFTAHTAMSQSGVVFGAPDLTSNAVETGGYRLMLVAEGDDSDGTDVWFARSLDFGGTWQTPYEIGTVSGSTLDYLRPDIAYGTGGFIHTSWTLVNTVAGQDDAIRYRRAVNYANGGISDWTIFYGLTTTTDGSEDVGARVTAAHTGGTVVVSYYSANNGQKTVQTSTNSGASFTVQPSLGQIGGLGLFAYPGSNGFGMIGLTTDQVVLRTATLAAPGTWTSAQAFADRPYPDDSGTPVGVDTDPSRGDRVAVAWRTFHGNAPDSVFFDAEWRDDPGYPNYTIRSPLTLAAGAASPPALANLDDDSALEIAFLDAGGNLRAYEWSANQMPGWPQLVGNVAPHAAVAVGDLDGDGKNDVVAGGPTGRVHAYRSDGSVMPGFPVSLGTLKQAYVSLGAFSTPPAHRIVACSGNKVWLIGSNGAIQPGFPVTTPLAVDILAPAAIGDMDGDGHREIVVGSGSQCLIYHDNGGAPFVIDVPGQTVSDAPTLADVDLDGTLEIAFPTFQGKMYLFNRLGVTRPGWPISDPNGTQLTSAAFANVAGLGEPEVAWANENDNVYLRDRDGINHVGWPHTTTPGFLLHGAPIVETTDNGSPDILVGGPDGNVWAWNNFNTNVPGWPKDIPGQVNVSGASGDVDNDGKVEVVWVTSTSLVILDTNANIHRSDPRAQWPMYGYNSQRTGCLACAPDVVTSAPGEMEAGRIEFAPPSPNPTQGPMRFHFRLPERSEVELDLYDIAGRLVRSEKLGSLAAGPHEVQWDGHAANGERLAAGLYHARLTVGGSHPETAARRIVLIP